MSDGVLLSRAWVKRIVMGLATVGAIALTVQGTTGQRPAPRDLRGAIPQNLRPDEYVVGTPWTGAPGVVVTVADLEARSAAERAGGRVVTRQQEDEGEFLLRPNLANPDAPAVSRWPMSNPAAADRTRGRPSVAVTLGSAIDGPTMADSGSVVPDSNGAVGPNQIMFTDNGVFKIFSKATGTQLASFSDDVFWASQTPFGAFDPHVRYDRTSGRWFITELGGGRILVAVSSGSDITSSSSFTLYSYAHDAPGGGGIDKGGSADYDTLGVDANALYVGVNVFEKPSGFATSVHVIRKSSVISGGPIVVTAFRGLMVGYPAPGAFTPQGVQNDDPLAAEGYFIGIDGAAYSKLDIYRVVTPGATPALSGAMTLTVPTTAFPVNQPASGSTHRLESFDNRLYAAELRTNRYTGVQTLWTAHTIGVTSTGVSPVYPAINQDRNAARWYEIGNLTTTPTLVQAGTVFDGAVSNPNGLTFPSIVMNGEGHAVLASTYAGATSTASIQFASRSFSDSPGTLGNPGVTVYRIGSTYNSFYYDPVLGQRWGDYSQTVVDPSDDMTIWTFQEYPYATDSWMVHAQSFKAPPPATPVLVQPSVVPHRLSTLITITGTSSGGSGFFDPGAGFANRIAFTFSGGVKAKSWLVLDPTHVQVEIDTMSATTGPINVSVTNPDGQTTGTSASFSVVNTLAGDFDGDRKSDMTLYRGDGRWWIRESTTNYAGATTVTFGVSESVPVPADYDGDGTIDPAVYDTSSGQWWILTSSSGYSVTWGVTWGGPGMVPVPGDYDGDGKADEAYYNVSKGQWLILPSGSPLSFKLGFNWGGPGYTPVPADFDGDGVTDVGLYQESTGSWYVLTSSSKYAATLNVNWGGRGFTLVPGDYDGDAKADFGLYERATGNWFVLLSSSSYTTSFTRQWGGLGKDPVPGDYDGDGRIDLAVVERATGNWTVLKSSTGYTTSFSVSNWSVPSDTLVSSAIPVGTSDLMRATDFDGDGRADITVYSDAGQWLALKSTTGYTTPLNKSWGGAGYTPAPGDFDGDGKVDLSLYQSATGNWYVLLSGFGFSTSLTKNAGGAGYVPVVGDYDGDGRSDFAVYNTTTGNWLMLKSSTNFTTVVSVNWGGAGYAPAPGDYDGDGKTDFGVYQQSTGNWYVLLSSTGYTASMTQNAGEPGYISVPGDYDGDGKTDFVVYNATTGLWFGLESSTNYTPAPIKYWGGPGYTPVQGDFDGDGKVDLVLYQTATGNWAILLSSTNYTTSLSKNWGGAGYTPVPKYP